MPQSEIHLSTIPRGTLLANAIDFIDMLLALPQKPHPCEFIFVTGGTGEDSFYCGSDAHTFCAECEREICEKHAKKCCMETYCSDCFVSHLCPILAVRAMEAAHG